MNTIITRESSLPLEHVCARLAQVAPQHQFGVLGVHDLRAKMASKGVAFDRECRVFEVCNPQQAKEILTGSIDVSAALPCRISVYEAGGRTVLATIRPSALLGLFSAEGGEAIAQEVEAALVQIMEESAKAG